MKTRIVCLLTLIAVLLGSNPNAEAQSSKKATTKKSVAVFHLKGAISEIPMADDFPFSLGATQGESLKDLIIRLKKAGDDDSVMSVVLMLGNASFGTAQAQEIRQAMDYITDKGKKIHVHCDMFTTSQYVVLSGASQLSMVPTGYMFITGLYGEQLFLRGLLDKIGIKPDYFTCGDYKSAAELFMRKSPSPEAEKMYNWLYDGLFEDSIQQIAKGRGVTPEKVRAWIDSGVYTAETAKEAGIIDVVQHRQDFEAEIRAKYGSDVVLDKSYGKKKKQTIDLSSPFGIIQFYAQLLQPPRRPKVSNNTIGVVYLEGMIVPGESDGSPFGSSGIAYSTTIRRALDKAANDGSIKAVVFRVNSGGGSAVASEIILDATRRVAKKKPLVVSMGDVAGSGGYYVACAAETIFADSSTITGSIGVVSGKFATTEMWNRLGINWKPIKRGANSGLLSSYAVFTDAERNAMQGYMDEVYGVFKNHVTAIRGDRLKKDIEELAGGRVYTGRQALELGLVDKLGGLDDAIQYAAKQAGLEKYEIRVVPRPKNVLEVLMSGMSGSGKDENHLSLIGPRNDWRSLFDAALPYLRGLDPQRLRVLQQSFKQLSLLQHERVILTMPPISFQN